VLTGRVSTKPNGRRVNPNPEGRLAISSSDLIST
jgi:hypothetical protein